jgi:hypothetical protein
VEHVHHGIAVSPELLLVSNADEVRLARLTLPDPEPLDEWVRRMRWAEAEREVRALLQERERQALAEKRRLRVGAAVFAAACVVLSLLPAVVAAVGG